MRLVELRRVREVVVRLRLLLFGVRALLDGEPTRRVKVDPLRASLDPGCRRVLELLPLRVVRLVVERKN